MPELPEVETVMRGLEPVMAGDSFAVVEQRRPNLRFAFPEDFVGRLVGQEVLGLERRAKYILVHLSSGECLVMHLGMSGRFIIHQAGVEPGSEVNPVHTHVAFQMSKGASIEYNDPRRFGFMILVEKGGFGSHKLFHSLGVEPLGDDFTAGYLAERARGKSVSIKSFLMNQKMIAGLGNIYVCEALYRAGIAPEAVASKLASKSGKPNAKTGKLVSAIKSVLSEAIKAGGSSLRDHRQTDGSLGYFQHAFAVYGRAREPCNQQGCGGTIARIVQNGRSSFYCPHCQTG